MPSISQNDEQTLLTAVQKVATLVESGLSPDSAIEKVARDSQFAPGTINILCHSFNTGRQLHQMRENTETQKKFASFELANPSKVISAIYGKTQTKEASVDVERLIAKRREQLNPDNRSKLAQAPLSSPFEKAASSATTADKPVPQHQLFREYELSKVAYNEARLDVCRCEDRIRGLFHKLATELFSRDLAEVEAVARSRFGKLAEPIFDHITSLPTFSRRKRASDNMLIKSAVSFQQTPYSTVEEIVKLATDLAKFRTALESRKVACDAAADKLRLPHVTHGVKKEASTQKEVTGNADSDVGPLFRKASFLVPPALGVAIGSGVGRTVGNYPKEKADLIDDEIHKLDDPAHMNEIRKIRTSAMLNSMLTDPDDPISGFDPDEVVGAYNEISRLAPHSSEQPAVIRPLLQRRLQGNVQPFEAKEITDIEKGITSARSPARSILDNVS